MYDAIVVRKELLQNKIFLNKLYNGNSKQNSRLLDSAFDYQVNLLLKVLWLICEGEIKITEESHKKILKARRLNFLKRHLNSHPQLMHVIRFSTEKKVTILKNFCALYHDLLYTFFNKNWN